MRAVKTMAFALSAILLVACDEMPSQNPGPEPPDRTTSDTATSPNATPSQVADSLKQLVELSRRRTPIGHFDMTLIKPARAVLDAALAYSSMCWLASSWFDRRTSYDRCWPVEACSPTFKLNDIPCGVPPDGRANIAKTSKALSAAAEGKNLTAKAEVFVRHVRLFAEFVAGSDPLPECLSRTEGDSWSRPECWHTTQGTTAYYQGMLEAWNAWQPSERRDVLPNERHLTGGGTTAAFSKKGMREGLRWGKCADGLCAYGTWDTH